MKHNKFKVTFIFITVFVFFCLIINTYAETKYLVLLSNVNIRKGPGTNYSTIITGSVGNTYNITNAEIIPDEPKNGNCNSGWYEIDYKGEKAYVCSSYTRIETEEKNSNATTACEKEMEAAGFPSSYWKGLCSLKSKHPNWVFKAVDTKLDFATAVDKFTSCGSSLLSNPKAEWKDTTCTYKEGSFVSVNQTAVAFYLDPRNFFTENYIFQFEDSRYNNNLEQGYTVASRSIISPTQFYKYHQNLKNDLADLLQKGGKETSVSSVHLASRMYQELGTNTRLKNLYQGTFNGEISYAPINPATNNHIYDFRGLYNFYNIGVTGGCVQSGGPGATYCALNYAKNHGWNSVYNGVKGGGTFLDTEYIKLGQYTSYFERFNVVPTNSNKLYIHYYMANMAAPSNEASTAYNAYKNSNLLDSAFVFYIPVYKNMSATISNSSDGAVDPGTSPSSPSTSEIPTIITSAGFKISNNYINGISANSSADSIKNNLESIAGSGTVTIIDANGKSITNELIGTGSKITIKNSKETKTYTVVVKGDTSGDGIINAKDLLQIQKSILGTYKLDDAYKVAGDTSGDNVVNAKDLLQVQKNILGTFKIS